MKLNHKLIKLLIPVILILLVVLILLLIANSKGILKEKQAVISVKNTEYTANEDGDTIDIGPDELWLGTGAILDKSYTGVGFSAEEVKGKQINFARLRVTPENDVWIGTQFDLYSELSPASKVFSQDGPPSERTLSKLKLEYSADANWKAGQDYFFDVTGPVRELFGQYPDAGTITIIARSTAGTPYGRKYVPVKNIRLIVDYLSND